MDWTSILANESTEKEKMYMVAVGFATWMRKWVVDLEDESTPISDGKRPRRSSPNEETYKDWAIIPMDSPDRAINDQPILEGAPSGVSALLEEKIPIGGPSNVEEIREGSPSRVAATPLPPPRPTDTVSSSRRPPDEHVRSSL